MLEQTPPDVAFALGFMSALALRRKRIGAIIDRSMEAMGIDSRDE